MTINLKNDETERLSRELARTTGESLTAAITTAVRERLDRLTWEAGAEERFRRATEISETARAHWMPEFLEIDHANVLYDELGLPK